MKNLSVLTIPIASPPSTPPAPGFVHVFFNEEGQLQEMGADGIIQRLNPEKHTAQVTLTESFTIVDVIDNNEFIVEGDITARIEDRTIIRIDGSTDGGNDGIITARSAELDGVNTKVRIRRGRLTANVADKGQLHLAKDVNIEHLLGTNALTFSIRNLATGESVSITDKTVDENNLLLVPDSPVLGDFLVTVLA